jgi:uncharacterized membrane protein
MMKTAITASALALLISLTATTINHVDAFAPAPSMLRTANTVPLEQQQVKLSSLRFSNKKNEVEEQMMMQQQPAEKEKRKSTDPTPFFISMFQNAVNNDYSSNIKMATAAMAFGLMLLPLPSEAAMSGGRMGGSFSAPRSRSMSAPRSSYGGGRGGGGYSRGYSGGSYYSRPNVIVAPMMSPFGYGGGGYYGGAGAMSYSRGPDLFSLVLFGGALLAVTNVVSSAGNQIMEDGETGGASLFGSNAVMSSLGPGTSVVQLSVAMQVPDRDDPNSILAALNRLSKTARTDSRVGIANLTSQVALEILRRKSSIVSACGNAQHFGDRTKASREYQSKSIQERAKFETESISKYGGVDYSSSNNNSNKKNNDGSSKATMAVITLVLAIDGDSTSKGLSNKGNMINSMSDVEKALQRIASDTKVDDCLQSAEILWTPEDRSETLSLRGIVADYSSTQN